MGTAGECGGARPEAGPFFTLAEVAKHSSDREAWLVIHDRVYDVTRFLDEHPGGDKVLLEQAGRDATESFEDVGHSMDAKEMLKQYLMGEVHPVKSGPPNTFGVLVIFVVKGFLPGEQLLLLPRPWEPFVCLGLAYLRIPV
uniref:Cytochrome b5 heme-binding domain-containing protein n=1 Tax=Pseudonaja textilis TaxID=8673 RepID=A0A670Z2M4_PSETE